MFGCASGLPSSTCRKESMCVASLYCHGTCHCLLPANLLDYVREQCAEGNALTAPNSLKAQAEADKAYAKLAPSEGAKDKPKSRLPKGAGIDDVPAFVYDRIASSEEPDDLLESIFGNRAATIGQDQVLQFWDLESLKKVHEITPTKKGASATSLRFSADGKRCAFYDGKASLIVVDVEKSKELRRIDVGQPDSRSPCAIALTPDGRTLAFARQYGDSSPRLRGGGSCPVAGP
jgi:hypothetical protein